jgi:hypothetical protein
VQARYDFHIPRLHFPHTAHALGHVVIRSVFIANKNLNLMEMISAEQIMLRGSFSYINDNTSFFINDDQTQGRVLTPISLAYTS